MNRSAQISGGANLDYSKLPQVARTVRQKALPAALTDPSALSQCMSLKMEPRDISSI